MRLRGFLYASAALVALGAPAYADDAAIEKRLDAMQKMIEAQQHQIEAQNAQIKSLRSALKKKGMPVETAATPPAPAPVEVQVQQQQVRLGDLERKVDAQNE
jgi:phosphate-selective porin OprO/OprP